ncbi:AAA family ATPase [Mucilaginibacter gynuensis]|uniref:AAA family ATPase n=1 Tax=Mucilaginibacter gynuensis TaxID=1302236 RepID=A0ABP8HKX7_9SPHI
MRINIMGASGSGVTTLGEALAKEIEYPYFDSDKYFWEPTTNPFTVRREINSRNTMLSDALAGKEQWVLGGPVMGWGLQPYPEVDLVVFLFVPPAIRMARVKKREFERYGDAIYNGARHKQYVDFLAFAASYDDPKTTTTSRTLHRQREWLQSLKCPVLEIVGDTSVADRLKQVHARIDRLRAASA